ncbi:MULTISPECIES: DUF2953 domain-containing protein [unclassified Bacillus (in: firmicutes)]|uniref:DUF2953 domain-containing protein n=1 Tax=unclassified Bacillus (in: firmicutes) TaxID=185979 RepID=UPI0008E57696|nr:MULTISPECIES: DUF2953 domain-containing protein [unclassified Bacillus (in: firmicutes)]SFB17559.1 Protein of unknown function [Bacillus sp. UNCCL13]SFQ76892.1 Protein of unknown function [Bacillus sp. cl95]
MKWLILALVILLFLLLVIVVTKISMKVSYQHAKDNDHLKLEFKAWMGLLRYKLDVPLIKFDDNSPTIVVKEKVQKGQQEKTTSEDTKQFSARDLVNGVHDTKEMLVHVFGLHKIIRKFLKKVSVRKIEWQSVVGLGEASHTAMIAGALWAIKGSLLGLISHYFRLKDMPNIVIHPQFQMTISQTRFSCIFEFRIGHAIVVGLKLFKFWKGGRPNFKTKPLSVMSNDKSKSV